MKRQNGITLIALVITIVVLLILAAVSITALTDEDKGVVTKAKQASQKTEDASEQEDEDIREIIEYAESEDWGNHSTPQVPAPEVPEPEIPEDDIILDIYEKVYLYRPGAASASTTSLVSIQVLGEPDNELVKIYLSNDSLSSSDVDEIKANGSGFTYTNVTTPVKYLPTEKRFMYLWIEYEDGRTSNVLKFTVQTVKSSSSQVNYGVVVG